MKYFLSFLLILISFPFTFSWQLKPDATDYLEANKASHLTRILNGSPIYYNYIYSDVEYKPEEVEELINAAWKFWTESTLEQLPLATNKFYDIYEMLKDSTINLVGVGCFDDTVKGDIPSKYLCKEGEQAPDLTLHFTDQETIHKKHSNAEAFITRNTIVLPETDNFEDLIHEFGHWLGFADLYYNEYEELGHRDAIYGTNAAWDSIFKPGNFSCSDADGMINYIDLSYHISRGGDMGWESLCQDGTIYVRGKVKNREPYLEQVKEKIYLYEFDEKFLFKGSEFDLSKIEQRGIGNLPVFVTWVRDASGKVISATDTSGKYWRFVYQQENTYGLQITNGQLRDYMHIVWNNMEAVELDPEIASADHSDFERTALLEASATINQADGQWFLESRKDGESVAWERNEKSTKQGSGNTREYQKIIVSFGNNELSTTVVEEFYQDSLCKKSPEWEISYGSFEEENATSNDNLLYNADEHKHYQVSLLNDQGNEISTTQREWTSCAQKRFNIAKAEGKLPRWDNRVQDQYMRYPLLLSLEQFLHFLPQKHERDIDELKWLNRPDIAKYLDVPIEIITSDNSAFWYYEWMLKAEYVHNLWDSCNGSIAEAEINKKFTEFEEKLAELTAHHVFFNSEAKVWSTFLQKNLSKEEITKFLENQIMILDNQLEGLKEVSEEVKEYSKKIFMAPLVKKTCPISTDK